MKTFGLYITGQKGRMVLRGLLYRPAFVVTYQDENTDVLDFDIINLFCEQRDIPIYHRKDKVIPSADVDLLIFVGWQYLIHRDMEKSVVFHDSYLPELKGFAPTPTALIQGRQLGATAFQPTDIEVDTGPIYLRRRIKVQHPIRLMQANELIATNYIEMIKELLTCNIEPGWPESDELETFSIWRGPDDMVIDWDDDDQRIQRTVYALGQPLSGAKTTYRGKQIILTEVQLRPDMVFVERHPGKIWSFKNNCPKVICGQGMLIIKEALSADGAIVQFNRLRERLGT